MQISWLYEPVKLLQTYVAGFCLGSIWLKVTFLSYKMALDAASFRICSFSFTGSQKTPNLAALNGGPRCQIRSEYKTATSSIPSG